MISCPRCGSLNVVREKTNYGGRVILLIALVSLGFISKVAMIVCIIILVIGYLLEWISNKSEWKWKCEKCGYIFTTKPLKVAEAENNNNKHL